MTPHITRILEAGNSAPSGENCQPWRFVAGESSIEVWNRPERDRSPYNWGQRGSYIAIGAAIENIVLAAGTEGFSAQIQYFPGPADHVATISLTSGGLRDELADVIAQRVTNRKPYRKVSLTTEQRKTILAASQTSQDPELRFVEAPKEIVALGRIGSINEEIMLANEALHSFFFSHINWTKREHDRNTTGFYIKTLELPPPAVLIFKLLRSWRRARFLCRLGINRFIARVNGTTNASASAIGAIAVSGIEPLDFVRAGRLLERVWLSATRSGLSMQPLTGVFFFKLLCDDRSIDLFSKTERSVIESGCTDAQQIFGIENKRIVAMFRIGPSKPPSARSSRFPLESALS